jgi:molybdopterin converting factor small subunit
MSLPSNRVAIAIMALLLVAPAVFAQSTGATPSSPTSSSPAQDTPGQTLGTKPTAPKKHTRRKINRTLHPKKVVVRQGGTTETLPQMAPGGPERQESTERRKSGQLLSATEANLKKLDGKKLSADQQATVVQIRQFMEQSRTALDAGDLTQGYNLATKANVLSEELSKQ